MFEIGPALREARERRGLAYSQVEDATAIRSRYLRALEEEDCRTLPVPAFAKGIVGVAAECVGMDGQHFVADLRSRHHGPRRGQGQPIYATPRRGWWWRELNSSMKSCPSRPTNSAYAR